MLSQRAALIFIKQHKRRAGTARPTSHQESIGCFLLSKFFKLFDFRPNDHRTVGRIRVFFKIILMIIFCGKELYERDNFCHDRIIKFLGFLVFGVFCNFSLFLVMVEDDRTVMCSYISALAVKSCGVMCLPEQI